MAFVEEHGVASATRRVDDRWTLPSGIAFAVLFVLGFIFGADTPEYDQPDAEWTQWFDDSGNRTMQLLSMFLLVLSAVAFVVFITGLVRRLRAHPVADEGATQVAYGGGLLLAAAIAIGGIAKNQISGAIELGDLPVPSGEIIRVSEQLGYGILLVAGGLFASLTVAAISIAGRRTTLLPQWLVIAGFVVAVILLFSVAWIPMAVLPLWVLAAAFTIGRANDGNVRERGTAAR